MPKFVVFSTDLSFSVCKGIVELDRRMVGIEWLIIRHSPPRTFKGVIRSQFRQLRKNGWRWIPYRTRELMTELLSGTPDRDRAESASPGEEYRLLHLLARSNVQLIDTPDVHSEETLARVRTFAPDLGLSLRAPILRESLFNIPRLGTINLHKGQLPAYRGLPPAFWELWNDEPVVGCTVHRVSAELDKGDVVAETVVPCQRFSSVKGLQLVLDEIGVALTCDAVKAILAGTAQFQPQSPGGRTYTKPTLSQAAQLRRRLSRKAPQGPRLGRRLAKTAYLLACLYLWRPLSWAFSSSPTVIVLLYHRVNDEVRDSLTTGIEQFDRQMQQIRKHCVPVSIEQVISGKLPRDRWKPLVCVTFDDGYKDNYEVAVPLLLRYRIPAAFFVSTGFIDTQRDFPHDEGKVPRRLAKMSWEDLRDMTKHGFVVGSHTVNHIDCAKESVDTVRRELQQSLDTLRSELGLRDVILAYPFGGRQHMTPERLALVKQAGYSACLSAYGGFNRAPVERFNVLRCGVNWGFSDLAFRGRIAGVL